MPSRLSDGEASDNLRRANCWKLKPSVKSASGIISELMVQIYWRQEQWCSRELARRPAPVAEHQRSRTSRCHGRGSQCLVRFAFEVEAQQDRSRIFSFFVKPLVVFCVISKNYRESTTWLTNSSRPIEINNSSSRLPFKIGCRKSTWPGLLSISLHSSICGLLHKDMRKRIQSVSSGDPALFIVLWLRYRSIIDFRQIIRHLL